MSNNILGFRETPRKEYQKTFSFQTFTKSTIPYAILKHSKEEDRLLFFLSRGFFIKKGQTQKALNIIIQQFKMDFEVEYDFKIYTNTIPAFYIEDENREFFLKKFNREGVLKSVLDLSRDDLEDAKFILKKSIPSKKEDIEVLTSDILKAAERAAILMWISEDALSLLN